MNLINEILSSWRNMAKKHRIKKVVQHYILVEVGVGEGGGCLQSICILQNAIFRYVNTTLYVPTCHILTYSGLKGQGHEIWFD